MTVSVDRDWSENVKEKYHTPPGTFTKNADAIVKILLDGADNNATLALHRLMFYMNRAGDKLTNVQQLDKAKSELEKLIEEKHETLKN